MNFYVKKYSFFSEKLTIFANKYVERFSLFWGILCCKLRKKLYAKKLM
jgi:hypothetical protein